MSRHIRDNGIHHGRHVKVRNKHGHVIEHMALLMKFAINKILKSNTKIL